MAWGRGVAGKEVSAPPLSPGGRLARLGGCEGPRGDPRRVRGSCEGWVQAGPEGGALGTEIAKGRQRGKSGSPRRELRPLGEWISPRSGV